MIPVEKNANCVKLCKKRYIYLKVMMHKHMTKHNYKNNNNNNDDNNNNNNMLMVVTFRTAKRMNIRKNKESNTINTNKQTITTTITGTRTTL